MAISMAMAISKINDNWSTIFKLKIKKTFYFIFICKFYFFPLRLPLIFEIAIEIALLCNQITPHEFLLIL
jgi:hypothetical protein